MPPQVRVANELTSGPALWWEAPGRAVLRAPEGSPSIAQDRVWIESCFGAVSAGTERLVGAGRVPASLQSSMACPHMDGRFPFPVKYGYSVAGRVAAGPGAGSSVFALHPHQSRFSMPAGELKAVPANVPLSRAPLYPFVETALNAIWDAEIRPGERVAVVGGGGVGGAVAYLASRIAGVNVTLAEPESERARVLEKVGLREAAASAADLPSDAYDLVFHCTGQPAVLPHAIRACGAQGRVVELSWYGDRVVELKLGLDFHHGRKRIISSQVGAVSPAAGPRWNSERRTQAVMGLLADPAWDAFFTHEVAFVELPSFLESLVADGYRGLVCRVRY
ncbi:MAG TPA: zinc-binding alcohol dehydrogenase [Bdellovibrionota bacterium]|nr:zinc-binding alcohol dehydrogenase [Bdellovibrionota bacterium]